MKIDDTIPRYDLPVDFLMDDNITGNLLELYKMFPCKIKAGIFAVCLSGSVKVTLNLSEHFVKANDFITIIPGSFIQIHHASEDARVAFIGFSSSFINTVHFWKNMTSNLAAILNHPVISLPEENAAFYKNIISLLTKAADSPQSLLNNEVMISVIDIFYHTLTNIYHQIITPENEKKPREFEILGEFIRLAFENYMSEHKASFYANEIGLTLSHFCATIKKATGRTAQDIIRDLIIMDAKAQLKSSDARINKIAKSLGFSPTAFNRYFLEYVQMTPLDYRNS